MIKCKILTAPIRQGFSSRPLDSIEELELVLNEIGRNNIIEITCTTPYGSKNTFFVIIYEDNYQSE